MGAAITARYANRHPSALDRIVLVGPAGVSDALPPQVTLLRVRGLGDWYFEHNFRQVMLDHLQQNLSHPMYAYPNVLYEFREQLEVPGTARAMLATLRDALLVDATDDFRGLGLLRRPTRVIWGKEDRFVPPSSTQEALLEAIPQARVCERQCVIPGAGHLPYVEKPSEFNELVVQFFCRQ